MAVYYKRICIMYICIQHNYMHLTKQYCGYIFTEHFAGSRTYLVFLYRDGRLHFSLYRSRKQTVVRIISVMQVFKNIWATRQTPIFTYCLHKTRNLIDSSSLGDEHSPRSLVKNLQRHVSGKNRDGSKPSNLT